MLQRYLIPVIALCVIFQRGFAETPRIMKSNKSIKVIPASGEIHSRNRRSTEFTAEQIQDIVDRHNFHRRNVSPGASNMEYMEWDDDLATMAQQWSDGCYYGHGQPPNLTPYSWIGQNLFASTNAGTDGVQATNSWNAEDQYYDYYNDNCTDVCGHYTQNVWATSNRIGCGVRFCSNPTGLPWDAANLITCNYGPGGNIQGERPYLLGPACTECSSGVGECDNGLCRPCADHNGDCVCKAICHNCGTVSDSCTCDCQDGWLGADCSKECGNYDDRCWSGWYPNWCNDNYPYVPENCPLMCDLCVEVDPNFVCNPTTDQPPTEAPLPPTEAPLPPTEEPRPPTEEPRPPTDEPRPPTEEPRPPTEEPRPPTDEPRPPTDEPRPPTEEPRPSTDEPRPPTEEPRPPTDEPRPPTEEPRPPTEEPGCDLVCENDGLCTQDGSSTFCNCRYGFGGPTCRRAVVYCPCNRPK